MKKSRGQQLKYLSKKNYSRFARSNRRKNRSTSQVRFNFGQPEITDRTGKKPKKRDLPKAKLPGILNFLLINSLNFTNHKARISNSGMLSVPEIFSITRNPQQTNQFLKDLLYTLRFSQSNSLRINYSRCKEIDLGASITMDIILKEFITYFDDLESKGIHRGIRRIEAIKADNPNVLRFLYAIGAHSTIRGVKANFPGVITYPLKVGLKGENIGQKEVESTRLVEHIEKCLGKVNRTLNQDSSEYLADIIGEVLNNAEIHSSTNYRYSIGHFEAPSHPSNDLGVFQFVIFNFGQTFYERANDQESCQNPDVVKEMRTLSKKYTERNWLGFGVDKLKEESLWTLYMLQDGVSCISPHRGNGTIQFIESFLGLRGNDEDRISKMTLISGNTRIVFDGTYKTVEKINDSGEKHTIISFNETSSLSELPDDKFVKFDEHFFPGTMIYARINIKGTNLEDG